MDAEYYALDSTEGGKFEPFQPALTLLTTVVSGHHEGFMTVDAGLKAVYRDGPPPTPISGKEWRYEWFGDEYGKLVFPADNDSGQNACLKVGDTVEMIVSHCDPTVNLFDCFFVVRDEVVIEVWPIDARGKCA